MEVVGTPKRIQVTRSNELTAQGSHYRMRIGDTVKSHHGNLEFWISPHKENGDNGRKIAENYRVFPEGDHVFKDLYGAGCNTSEGRDAHHKTTDPHKRAQAVGRIPILLDAHLCFIHDNAKSWYFQTGWRIVDRLVHDPGVNLMKQALERAS